MSVYKEVLRLVQRTERESTQIYPDACDYGVRVESNDDEVVKELKNVCEMFQLKPKTVKYGTGATQTVLVEWYDEWNTGEKRLSTFTYVHIQKDHRRSDRSLQGYLSVETVKG